MAVVVPNRPAPCFVYAEFVDDDDVTCVCAYPSGGFEVWLGNPPRRNANILSVPQRWWFEPDRGPIARFSTLDREIRERRSDAEFMTRIRARVEQDRELLDRLAEDD